MSAPHLTVRALAKLLVLCALFGICFSFRLQPIQTRLVSGGQQFAKFQSVAKALEPVIEHDQHASYTVSPNTGITQQFKNYKSHPAALWTKAMDKKLVKEMQKTPHRTWKDIASSIGEGISTHQCVYRWDTHLKLKNIAKDNDAPWTEEEYTLLTQLVAQSPPKKRISWKSIGAQLNRVPLSCRIKWDTELYVPQGYFSSEEENVIMETVREASQQANQKKDQETRNDTEGMTEEDTATNSVKEKDVVRDRGLWARLGRQLGRSDHIVRARYLALVCAFKTRVQWTDEMDAALTRLLSKNATAPDWENIATSMKEKGHQVRGRECCNRWHVYQKYIHRGMRSCADWTPTELAKLMEMRTARHSWEEIGRALNVVPSVCCRRWHLQHDAGLKRGPFTPEEDECIRVYVKEWGDPKSKPGLWQKLKAVLQRPGLYIRQRWYNTLYHEK